MDWSIILDAYDWSKNWTKLQAAALATPEDVPHTNRCSDFTPTQPGILRTVTRKLLREELFRINGMKRWCVFPLDMLYPPYRPTLVIRWSQLWSGDPKCSPKTNLPSLASSTNAHPSLPSPLTSPHPHSSFASRGVSNFPKAQAKEAPVEFQVTLVTWTKHQRKLVESIMDLCSSLPFHNCNLLYIWPFQMGADFHKSPACRSTKPSFQTCPGSNWKDDAHAVGGRTPWMGTRQDENE